MIKQISENGKQYWKSLDELSDTPGFQSWVEKEFPSTNILDPINKRSQNKKIRIGYYSADFRNHAMSYLLVNLFELHDKSKFELIAFSFVILLSLDPLPAAKIIALI